MLIRARARIRRSWVGAAACGVAATLGLACAALKALRDEERAYREVATLRGSVRTEHPSTHPLVVVLGHYRDDGELEIASSYTVARPGGWVFRVLPGRYALGAFEDVSEDLVYRNEPALLPSQGPVHEVHAGELVADVELVIPPDPPTTDAAPYDVVAALEAVRARSAETQVAVTLDQVAAIGDVVSLDDPRFDRQYADLGVMSPSDFLTRVRPGIYFLEEYDPDRTPVLFVHGMRATPRDFHALVAGLDRERFQPWIFYYPSGARLQRVSDWLADKMLELQLRLRFDRLAVVAHSMGGLVSRAFILKYGGQVRSGRVVLFVSISSPWGGNRTAGLGTKLTPEDRATWASWRDLAPESEFLRGLFLSTRDGREAPRPLPEGVAYHLVFGSPDEVVPPESSLALTQYEEARVRRFPFGHTEILERAETISWLNQLLAGSVR